MRRTVVDDERPASELLGRARGLLALHRRALAEADAQRRIALTDPDRCVATAAAQEARSCDALACGAADEADRLRELAAVLRSRSAAW